jgi:Fe/S biogenesis protein NfuA
MSSTEATSPLAAAEPADDMVITLTPRAVERLKELRDEEPEGDRLGLRIEILGEEGTDFAYDLSFQIVTKAEMSDVIRNHDGLRVIIPAKDTQNLEGATLDFEPDGLVMRNPNRPKPFRLEGLTHDDELSAEISVIIDTDINPALAAHGGYITYVGHDGEGKAFVTMGGGCHGCAMSRMTMLQGVQQAIKDAVPAVERVIDVTDHTTGENPYYTA